MGTAGHGRRRIGVRLGLAAVTGVLVLGPAVLAAPAQAATSTPTPVPSEPPGGATCSPDAPAVDCQQEGGSTAPTPTSTPTPSPSTSTTSSSGSSNGSGTGNLPRTGGTPSLAHTGPDDALLSGLAGAALLASGAMLVLAGRRSSRSPH
jgi:LPXTG-motif cell wall-anchored protein